MNVNEMYNSEIFFKRLSEISGLNTQKEIADKFLFSERKVSSWHNKIPSIHDLLSIAYEYHCSIDYLLGMDSAETLATKQYTARDVCRILTAIDREYDLIFNITEEEANYDDKYDPSENDNVVQSRTCVDLRFYPHSYIINEVQTGYKVPEYADVAGFPKNTAVYNHSGVHINNYLNNYAKVRELDIYPDIKRHLVDALINKVPNTLPIHSPDYEMKLNIPENLFDTVDFMNLPDAY